MNHKRKLGEKLKRVRKQKGYTQEQLAEIVDISSRNLSNIEVGANFPKAETLERLLIALNITPEELFASDHIKSNAELIEDIYFYVNSAKDDHVTLEKMYKILRDLVKEI